jgi:hypothetical protein
LNSKGVPYPGRTAAVGVVIDGPVVRGLPPSDAFSPLPADTLSVEPWPAGTSDALRLLDFLARRHTARPLLGLTRRPLTDELGHPLRGISRSGSGLALASCHGLAPEAATGVMRHELAHALGLDHCGRWDCALSERPHPMGVADRPASLCSDCQARWEHLAEGGS